MWLESDFKSGTRLGYIFLAFAGQQGRKYGQNTLAYQFYIYTVYSEFRLIGIRIKGIFALVGFNSENHLLNNSK